jgi:hypothetical protein
LDVAARQSTVAAVEIGVRVRWDALALSEPSHSLSLVLI